MAGLMIAVTPAALRADPGTGLIVLPGGAVVFGDPARNQVWRIDPDGQVTVLVRDRHTHLLRLDAGGAIIGEHLEYLSATNQWQSSLWRLGPGDRTPIDIEGPRTSVETFPGGMSLRIDSAGRAYSWRWIGTGRTGQQLVRRVPGGRLETLTVSGWAPLGGSTIPRQFGQLASIAFAPGETLVIAELTRVVQVNERGAVRLLAESRGLPTNAAALEGGAYLARFWGVAAVPGGSVYVADGAHRQVVRLAEGRSPVALAIISDRFFPVGVAVAGNQLYVLEYPDPDAQAPTGPRVRVVPLDGRSPARVLGATPPTP